MARMPPPRAPTAPCPLVAFETADGRRIYIDREAVSAIYDQERPRQGVWTPIDAATPQDAVTNGQGYYWRTELASPTAVIAVGTQALVVPYTADQVLDILYG